MSFLIGELSKLLFAFVLFSYETGCIDLFYNLSKKKHGLTDFICSVANAMNGNYVFQTGKETFLAQHNVLSFIVYYLKDSNNNVNDNTLC